MDSIEIQTEDCSGCLGHFVMTFTLVQNRDKCHFLFVGKRIEQQYNWKAQTWTQTASEGGLVEWVELVEWVLEALKIDIFIQKTGKI